MSNDFVDVGVGNQYGVNKSGGDVDDIGSGISGADAHSCSSAYGYEGDASATAGNTSATAGAATGGNITATGGAGGSDQTTIGDITINT